MRVQGAPDVDLFGIGLEAAREDSKEWVCSSSGGYGWRLFPQTLPSRLSTPQYQSRLLVHPLQNAVSFPLVSIDKLGFRVR